MEVAFEEKEKCIRLSKFNERVARSCYKLSSTRDVEQYMRELKPPKPIRKNNFQKETKTFDISAALECID